MSKWAWLTVFVLLLAAPARADWLFGLAPAHTAPPAFGMREVRENVDVFYKWTGAVARMDADSAVPQLWLDDDLSTLNLRQQATAVNNLVNGYPDISDERNWGQDDYWETPAEFFARGGDCEDFAIAKYAWLRWLGVPEDRLRLAMVYDRAKKATHMLLVVYAGGDTLFLDSQRRDIRTHNDFARYWPLYSINRQGSWIVDQRGQGKRIVASLLASASGAGSR